MNDTRRPWTYPLVAGIVCLVVAFSVADVAGLTPRQPIEPSAGQPRVPRVAEPARIEAVDPASPRPSAIPTPAPVNTPESSAASPRGVPERSPRPDRPASKRGRDAHGGPDRRHVGPRQDRSHRPAPLRRSRSMRAAPPLAATPQPVAPPQVTVPPVPAPPVPAPPVPAPPAAAPAPAPPALALPAPLPAPRRTHPAQVVNLDSWKLTLPIGRKGRPQEIRQPGLASFVDGRFFTLDSAAAGVVFRAPVGGVTTENSHYARSELREMAGQREAAWSSRRGAHVLTISQAITATPRAKPHVVAAQIHDAHDDVMAIRLEGTRLFVDAGGRDAGILDPHYVLGSKYTVEISATSAGVTVTYNGSRVVTVRATGNGWYFKVGCYPQSNRSRGDRPDAFGEVVVYGLALRHS